MTFAAILTIAAGSAWLAPIGMAVGLSMIALAASAKGRRG